MSPWQAIFRHIGLVVVLLSMTCECPAGQVKRVVLDTTETEVLLGNIHATSIAEVEFVVKSDENTSCIITSVITSCGCATAEAPAMPLTVAQGELSLPIRMKWDLAGQQGSARTFVHFLNNSGHPFRTAVLKCEIELAMSVVPRRAYQNPAEFRRSGVSFSIQAGSRPLENIRIDLDPEWVGLLEVKSPMVLSANNQCTVTLALRNNRTSGFPPYGFCAVRAAGVGEQRFGWSLRETGENR